MKEERTDKIVESHIPKERNSEEIMGIKPQPIIPIFLHKARKPDSVNSKHFWDDIGTSKTAKAKGKRDKLFG
jgi:hypothetical protein